MSTVVQSTHVQQVALVLCQLMLHLHFDLLIVRHFSWNNYGVCGGQRLHRLVVWPI